MTRDVIAIIDTGDRDRDFLHDALAFCDLHEAHLTFLLLSPMPVGDYLSALAPPYSRLDEWVDRAQEKKARAEDLLRRRSGEVRVISDDPLEVLRKLATQARYADLVLMGPEAAYADSRFRQHAAEAVFLSSGRPLLLWPAGRPPRLFEHLALGWNASREATHALKDALPLLAPGARVDVLVVDGIPSEGGHGSEPGADIAHHLARRGFEVKLHEQPSCGSNVAEVLQSLVRRQSADLLAVGGYAHSRYRELILGGVTRDLLHECPVPCLISH